VLDLANNELGNESAQHIRHVLPQLFTLNLSNTKLGAPGCIELAKGISACESLKLKHLDLSNNNIESKGFAKLLESLRESTQIMVINVAENDMSLYQEHFESLTHFLKQNESL